MSWLAICDRAPTHTKTVFVGNEAFGALVRMAAWSAGEGLDGFVPEHMALMFACRQDVLDKLCTPPPHWKSPFGFLERTEGGYRVHDFDGYNPTSEQQAARRAALSERRSLAGSAGAARRWQSDGKAMAKRWQSDGKAMANLPPVCHDRSMANDSPLPHPLPIPIEICETPPAPPPKAPKAKGKTKSACLESTDPGAKDWCTANGVDWADSESRRFLDHHFTKGNRFISWAAAWRNWKAGRFVNTGGSPSGGNTNSWAGKGSRIDVQPYHAPYRPPRADPPAERHVGAAALGGILGALEGLGPRPVLSGGDTHVAESD